MKILAIASAGGHWVQLLRLESAFKGHELIYLSTKKDFGKMVEGHQFISVADANRNDKLGLLKTFKALKAIIRSVKPDLVVTTGAAPGLMGLMAGKLYGSKTIWIDSIANAEKLSMSGQIALTFADKVYTQWPDLANKKIIYSGNVLS